MKSDATLPYWPRAMPRALASSYLGMSVSAFDVAVKEGIAPKAVMVPKAGPRWLRDHLDAFLNTLAEPTDANPWDAP